MAVCFIEVLMCRVWKKQESMNEKSWPEHSIFPQVGSYHAEIKCTEKGAKEDILLHVSFSSPALFINNKYWWSETVLVYFKIQYEIDLNAKYILYNTYIHTHTIT